MATAAAAANGPSMELKIMVNKRKNKVMFAEAKKEFVDFIFHILSLPLGAVQRVLTETSTILGSIGTLREGLKNLDAKYMENPAKDYLLDNLKAPYWGKNTSLLLPEASWNQTRKFASPRNPSWDRTVAVGLAHYSHVNHFHRKMNLDCTELDLALVQGNAKGYVKELVTFLVMDDLVVQSAEPASAVSLLKQSIKDVGDIEEREVTFGTAEARKLLKASVSSKTVLTDVFLGGGAVKRKIDEETCMPPMLSRML